MPELTKEYLNNLLERMESLIKANVLAILDCDDDKHVIVEIWKAEDGMVSIYPIAVLLTEEEAVKLKLEGAIPTLKGGDKRI